MFPFMQGQGASNYAMQESLGGTVQVKPRGFKETVLDQIAYHKAKIADLQAVLDSMTPEVEKFVEAAQKLSR